MNERFRGKSPVPLVLLIAGFLLAGPGLVFSNAALLLAGYACWGLALASVAFLLNRDRQQNQGRGD
jgi:hypothetical protein